MAKKKKEKDFTDLENDRFGLFMDESSFELEVEFGRDYLEQDSPNYVILHRIDIIKTKKDKLYGEARASEKVFKPAIKIHGIINIDRGEQSFRGETGMVHDEVGNLNMRIYLKELEEKGVEINRGDILAYNYSGMKERYFEVVSANNITDETEKTFAGMKPYWKKVIAIPAKSDVVPFV